MLGDADPVTLYRWMPNLCPPNNFNGLSAHKYSERIKKGGDPYDITCE